MTHEDFERTNEELRGRLAIAEARVAELEATLSKQQTLSAALADTNAHAAELMVSLEEALEEQRALASALADANQLAQELARARDTEKKRAAELLATQRALEEELKAAALYVQSLLPAPLSGEIDTDWRFIPSAELGGDAFGYHWLDRDHFAMYLLDVCGHGLAATLLATSVLTLLRAERLGAVDFREPAQVLEALNDAFPMARHNDTYFTIWYGVFHKAKREIAYSSGGHPPALLFSPGARKDARELATPNPMIGVAPGVSFSSGSQQVGPSDTMFLFSDGVYEITRTDGRLIGFDEFVATLDAPALDASVRFARDARGKDALDDDFSLVRVRFG